MANRTIHVGAQGLPALGSASISILSTDGQILGSGTATNQSGFAVDIGERVAFVPRYNSGSGSFYGWGKSANLTEEGNGFRFTVEFDDAAQIVALFR